jgi:hypothetical protein
MSRLGSFGDQHGSQPSVRGGNSETERLEAAGRRGGSSPGEVPQQQTRSRSRRNQTPHTVHARLQISQDRVRHTERHRSHAHDPKTPVYPAPSRCCCRSAIRQQTLWSLCLITCPHCLQQSHWALGCTRHIGLESIPSKACENDTARLARCAKRLGAAVQQRAGRGPHQPAKDAEAPNVWQSWFRTASSSSAISSLAGPLNPGAPNLRKNPGRGHRSSPTSSPQSEALSPGTSPLSSRRKRSPPCYHKM